MSSYLQSHRLFLTLLILVAIVAAGVNVVQFINIASNQPMEEVMHLQPSLGLDDIAERSQRTVRERFLVYLQLGRVAAGAEVTITNDSGLSRLHLEALTGASVVTVSEATDSLTAVEASWLDERSGDRGVLRDAGEYAIVVPSGEATRLVTIRGPGVLYLVDTEVLDELRAGLP